MGDLSDYFLAEFDQGKVLGSAHTEKTDVSEGICAALSIAWVRSVTGGAKADDMNALMKQFDMSINMQRIYEDAWSQTDGHRESVLNSISHVTQISVSEERYGESVGSLVSCCRTLTEGFYFVGLNFPEGHLIALEKRDDFDLFVFDPNYGTYLASSFEEIGDFISALFADYASRGDVLAHWDLLEISSAESARDRFSRQTGRS
ncbi:hypothetical protein AAFN86_20815 [Roseomonas sp. CAU 1739]|uniref:hypothetical protein n=1 Tax=Roseomonas sp. CAU 1739 TaxID=3140364 RepID=UPI00325BEF1D